VGLCTTADTETDMDVHDRAMLYYRLLKQDINEVMNVLLSLQLYLLLTQAKRVVCGNQRKFISTESNALQRVSIICMTCRVAKL